MWVVLSKEKILLKKAYYAKTILFSALVLRGVRGE
ncbi:hypothetical protein H828_YJM1478B00278 [Saccharomyces cerevisiae YJM1478]|jgi:hypothetical protein|uniref:Uncharacterized protein YBR196C-B n=5 Tax=Saccharomyces cerevisiae TaxID=4932 RepID=YB96B_YEAST|eukprot:NP_878052.3 hypothetical protein YBR196C-B [Saccharomyces cerevisiae S288C]